MTEAALNEGQEAVHAEHEQVAHKASRDENDATEGEEDAGVKSPAAGQDRSAFGDLQTMEYDPDAEASDSSVSASGPAAKTGAPQGMETMKYDSEEEAQPLEKQPAARRVAHKAASDANMETLVYDQDQDGDSAEAARESHGRSAPNIAGSHDDVADAQVEETRPDTHAHGFGAMQETMVYVDDEQADDAQREGSVGGAGSRQIAETLAPSDSQKSIPVQPTAADSIAATLVYEEDQNGAASACNSAETFVCGDDETGLTGPANAAPAAVARRNMTETVVYGDSQSSASDAGKTNENAVNGAETIAYNDDNESSGSGLAGSGRNSQKTNLDPQAQGDDGGKEQTSNVDVRNMETFVYDEGEENQGAQAQGKSAAVDPGLAKNVTSDRHASGSLGKPDQPLSKAEAKQPQRTAERVQADDGSATEGEDDDEDLMYAEANNPDIPTALLLQGTRLTVLTSPLLRCEVCWCSD